MVDESFIILSKTKYFYKYYLLPTPFRGVVSNTLKNLLFCVVCVKVVIAWSAHNLEAPCTVHKKPYRGSAIVTRHPSIHYPVSFTSIIVLSLVIIVSHGRGQYHCGSSAVYPVAPSHKA